MGKRRFHKKSGMSTKKLNKKVNKLARTLKPEMKSKDVLENSVNVTDTGTVISLAPVAEGVGELSRTGIKIRVKGIGLHCSWRTNLTPTQTTVRQIVYVDMRNVVDQKSTVTNILEEITPFSYINHRRIKKFRILLDKFFTLNNADRTTHSFRWWKKLDFVQGYNGALSTDIESKGINMMLISTESTNVPILTFSCRMIYTDV